MGYIVPSYAFISDKTRNLQEEFSKLIKRFMMANYSQARKNVENLNTAYETNVKNKKGVWFSNTEPEEIRLRQIACITQLCTILPEKADNEEAANSVLHGSIFYRYLRLEDAYKKGRVKKFNFYGNATERCALTKSLAETSKINAQNKLDPLTIYTCCMAYEDYLKKDGVKERFEYIKEDTQFFGKLRAIIECYEKKAQPMLQQIEYIQFIQSVSKFLVDSHSEVQNGVALLTKKLAQVLTKKKSISAAEVKETLSSLKLEKKMEYLINYFLPDFEEINKDSISEFEKTIKLSLNQHNQYSLLGAYILTLRHLKDKENETKDKTTKDLLKHLMMVLREAINATIENPLDTKSCKSALIAFENLLTVPDLVINYKVWGERAMMERELSNQLVELNQNKPSPIKTNQTETIVEALPVRGYWG